MARLQTRDVPLISVAEAVIRGEKERVKERERQTDRKRQRERSSAGILSAR